MRVRTNKYGETTISHAPVTQVSLSERVNGVLADYGVRTNGRLFTRACALVEAHPSLTAQQAVDYVISRL